MTTPYTDWAHAAPTKPYPAAVMGVTTTPTKSNDFGATECFDPSHLPIPFTNMTSAHDETPAALWGSSYPQVANGSAMFDGTLSTAFPEVLATGYDMAVTQVGLDEFINAL